MVPLHPDDRRYTQFITPWGRYKYLVVPHGFIAAGDGYTQQFDEILARFTNHRKLVDDSILRANSIKEMFFMTADFLSECAGAGVVFGEPKFQFCERKVEYVGFRVGDQAVKPTGDMLQALQEFPRPQDLTAVRSFFGLIEQVSWAFSKRDEMGPFRELLKSGTYLPEVEYPFQRLCWDYFALEGREYLVLVDRYLGWPIVQRAERSTAAELVKVMKQVCMTYGVPKELSSDGGTQFTWLSLKASASSGASARGFHPPTTLTPTHGPRSG